MMFGARNDRKGVRGLPLSRFRFLLPACQMEVQSHTEYRHRQSQARPTSHPTLPHESALVHYCAFGPSVGLGRAMSSTGCIEHAALSPEDGDEMQQVLEPQTNSQQAADEDVSYASFGGMHGPSSRVNVYVSV
jgi:hypothetical protein